MLQAVTSLIDVAEETSHSCTVGRLIFLSAFHLIKELPLQKQYTSLVYLNVLSEFVKRGGIFYTAAEKKCQCPPTR